MKYDTRNAHYVAVTGIIHKRGKYLIVKRSANDKVFPNRWKVPGGKLETSDYLKRKPNKKEGNTPIWYDVIEHVLEREIKEEVSLKINRVKYIKSIVFIRPDKVPALVISLVANYVSGKVKLNSDLSDYAWVDLQEAKKYKLVADIYKELVLADKILKR